MKIYAENKLDSANGWPTRGIISYVMDPSLRRNVAQLTLVAGAHDQSVLHESPVFHADGPTMWAAAWWRFPRDYSWEGAPGYAGREHKLMLFSVEDASGRGRLMVNAEGNGGNLRAYVEGYDGQGPLLLQTDTPLPLDGSWHYVEVQIDRDPSGQGIARLWLDGVLAGEGRGSTGNSPFTLVQVGAYANQGAAKAQSFYVHDFRCADVRLTTAVPPPPEPPKPPAPTEAEQIALALEGFNKQFAELARRVRALSAK